MKNNKRKPLPRNNSLSFIDSNQINILSNQVELLNNAMKRIANISEFEKSNPMMEHINAIAKANIIRN